MADFAYECPWCGRQVDMTYYYDYEDLVCEYLDKDHCPYCSKPVLVDVSVSAVVYVKKDDSAIKAEMELYEKRMRGDWS